MRAEADEICTNPTSTPTSTAGWAGAEEQVAQHERGHHVGGDLVAVVPGIALTLVRRDRPGGRGPASMKIAQALPAERREHLGEVVADHVPRARVGEGERDRLVIGVLPTARC